MRYLILSDIHANWEALTAVLQEAEGQYDQIVCCGDLVGYGADPNRVTDWIRASGAVVIRGNHDRACTGLDDLEYFNPVARTAAEWTGETLTAENRQYLRGLQAGPQNVNGFAMVHGSPVDEDEYVTTPYEATQLWPYLPSAITFFGHTHLQGGFQFVRKKAREMKKNTPLSPDGCYLINPGSVGQPRDQDPRAAWALYDGEARVLTYRRTPYDIASAQEKIIAAGLPPVLAMRLAAGG